MTQANINTPHSNFASPFPPPIIPPLENGDRLSREEFERRYEAMPHVKKAELLEGVVHMGSPGRVACRGFDTSSSGVA